jgi:methylenetetrahydrofolate dehydrogenase (NADP+)/methenyltetrahydrofolate cyclohydrolase
MSAQILDGKALGQRVQQALVPRIDRLAQQGVKVKLRVVRVGDDPASKVYVGAKLRASHAIGIDGGVVALPADVSLGTLFEQIDALNGDRSVHGILVQLPLPKGLDPHMIAAQLEPTKDVDGFHAVNLGRLLQGRVRFAPCTAAGVIRLLDDAGIDLRGKNAVVVGRSEVAGKPIALLLVERDATVAICHSKTRDLAAHTREADVLVVAAGRRELVNGPMVKAGAAVIDVGMNRTDTGTLVGDVDQASVALRAGFLTPVPGGVGPMTVAMLMENTVRAAELQCLGENGL